jgi:hypothetical protein
MKKVIYGSIAMLLLFTSCENYLDVNEEQTNRADFNLIAPNQMLAGVINGYTNHQVINLASFGNRSTYVWGLNSGFTATEPTWTHVFSSGDYSANFESTFIIADNCQDIIDKKSAFPNYGNHFGVAKVIKVMCMDYATALYGDVPYSEAFKSNISTPKYDDDKTIIPKLFAELDEARAYFNDTNAVPMGSEDIVFGGDLAEWTKFANTIELKLLMRLSKTTDPALVALRTARFAALNSNQDFISTDVTVNPGYNESSVGKRSPLYRAYGLNEGFSDWTSANRSNAAGDYIAKLINGTMNDANITTGIVDPRRARMFTLVPVVGNVQGVFPLTAISRFSSFYFGRSSAISPADADTNGCERDAFLMLAAESSFLQAEAFQRGYLTGDAQTAFKQGITDSFNFYSTGFGTVAFAPLNATTYITATNNKNGLGWTGSTDKIKAIMTQKYLALAQWHGIELYIDHMRTGFPVLPLPSGVSSTTRPNRLIYPTSEYSSNSANVPNVTNADLFTVSSKTPYYLQ